ncbi:MAG: isocitrate/isopropylmalate family dehydrogenase, partial [Chitinophagaceae bacterium]
MKIAVAKGDGIGPEITAATTRVLEATGVAFEWETVDAGVSYMERSGDVPDPYSQPKRE